MKFRFCGDQDAPDWILAEVSVLSKMSSVRMKLICRQVLNHLLGVGINYEKIQKLTQSDRIQFDANDTKAMLSALTFIFSNSAKFDVDEGHVLLSELQQLGLPRDVATAITKSFAQQKEQLKNHVQTQVLALPRVTDSRWRVDYILGSSDLSEVNGPSVRFNLTLTDTRQASLNCAALRKTDQPEKDEQEQRKAIQKASTQLPFQVSAEKFRVLYHDLKTARQLLNSVQ